MLADWREELRDRLEDGVHIITDENRLLQAQFAGSLRTIKQLQELDVDVLVGAMK